MSTIKGIIPLNLGSENQLFMKLIHNIHIHLHF